MARFERLGMENATRDFQHNHTRQTSEVILGTGKDETPGDTECPQLSLQSAGLRSLTHREVLGLSLDIASLRDVLQRKARASRNGSVLQTANSFV